MDLNEDFKEFVQLLNKNNVEYLVVGGYAVTAYGYPRYTGDIDFWIKPEEKNALLVIKSLKEFGFGDVDITLNDLTETDNVIQLGFPPNRIDILTSINGVAFDECWKERSEINVGGEKINFISLHHLKINKKETGRTQDKLDLENLP